jgi:hypothetical protein
MILSICVEITQLEHQLSKFCTSNLNFDESFIITLKSEIFLFLAEHYSCMSYIFSKQSVVTMVIFQYLFTQSILKKHRNKALREYILRLIRFLFVCCKYHAINPELLKSLKLYHTVLTVVRLCWPII